MDKLQLYNLALSLLDMSISDLQTPTKELSLLDLNYGKVVNFCMRAWDFPFMVKRASLADYEVDADLNPVAWGQYSYGYTVPEDFGRAVRINADKRNSYSYRFGRLWCNTSSPVLEYMPNKLYADLNGEYLAPDDFLALVAYQLALHIAPMLDPDGQTQSLAAQMYQLTLNSIIESETRSNDRPENYEASPSWDDGFLLTEQMIRDGIIKGEI